MPNVIEVGESGPYHAPSASVGGAPAAEHWLCRCGQSADKPFCDSSHRRTGFVDEARYAVRKLGEPTFGELRVDPQANGPLVVSGGVEVVDAAGTVVFRGDRVKLCRCGQSSTKPFCDASHDKHGFVAP